MLSEISPSTSATPRVYRMSDLSTGEPFSFSVRLGLVFVVQSAFLSALAVAGCLLFTTVSATDFWLVFEP